MISVIALIGGVVLVPLYLILERRGFTVWPDRADAGDAALCLPTLRDSWWLLVATIVTLIAAVAFAAGSFGQ